MSRTTCNIDRWNLFSPSLVFSPNNSSLSRDKIKNSKRPVFACKLDRVRISTIPDFYVCTIGYLEVVADRDTDWQERMVNATSHIRKYKVSTQIDTHSN